MTMTITTRSVVANDSDAARAFVVQHCSVCHDDKTQEANLNLRKLADDLSQPKVFSTWVKVFDRVRQGEMPPAGEPQPTVDQRRDFLASLEQRLIDSDLARRRSAGRASVRRLNRTEYEYTLRDLLDLPEIPVRDMLPEDGRAFGYDKSGDGLELSHVQIAKYLEVADLALDAATASQVAPPDVVYHREYPTQRNGYKAQLGQGDAVLLRDFKLDESILPLSGKVQMNPQRKAEMKALQDKLEAFTGSVGLFRQGGIEFNPYFHDFLVAHAGRYKLRMQFWSFSWDRGVIGPAQRQHVVQLRAGPKGKERSLGYFDIKSLKPTVVETEAWLVPGDKIGFNGTTLLPLALTGPGGRAAWSGQGLAVDWLEVDGPLYDRWPLESHRRLFGDVPLQQMASDSLLRVPDRSLPAVLGQLRGKARGAVKKLRPWAVTSNSPRADAEKLLQPFLSQAFRRPATTDETAEYVSIVEQMMSENLTFEDSLRWAYKTALCSPEFLFLAEPPGKLNDYALASRLSYFLWNSLPDQALLRAAAEKRLHQPDALREQVERMLNDPKAERFVNDFLDQWLDLGEIDATTPDKKLYPEFNAYLRDSMLAETRLFFDRLLREDLSVLNIVDSEFTMLNGRLAEHYDIAGIEGAKFREVKLPADCGRGGMMTQASLLKVTANGTTTTPVKRGTWVMREILGQPPEPPPPDVPAVEPDLNGTTTIREQLKQHRNNPACASCHARIDPPGFALESYDVIGGLRTRYRSLGEGEPTKSRDGRNVAYLLGPPVDPAGQLADGRRFENITELKRLLLANPDRIARNIIEQLLTYATGAEIRFSDRREVDKIVAHARANHFGLRSIMHAVVQSSLFQEQ